MDMMKSNAPGLNFDFDIGCDEKNEPGLLGNQMQFSCLILIMDARK